MTSKFNIIPLKNRRRELRKKSTICERLLWEQLRDRKLNYKFIRQYSIDGFVMDFFCPKAKLGIEIEGSVHEVAEVKIYDRYRYKYLEAFGVEILIFSNAQIVENIVGVVKIVKESLSLPKRGTKG